MGGGTVVSLGLSSPTEWGGGGGGDSLVGSSPTESSRFWSPDYAVNGWQACGLWGTPTIAPPYPRPRGTSKCNLSRVVCSALPCLIYNPDSPRPSLSNHELKPLLMVQWNKTNKQLMRPTFKFNQMLAFNWLSTRDRVSTSHPPDVIVFVNWKAAGQCIKLLSMISNLILLPFKQYNCIYTKKIKRLKVSRRKTSAQCTCIIMCMREWIKR